MEITAENTNLTTGIKNSEFEAWIEGMRSEGLVDMKFAIQASADGISTRKIIEELLTAERMIKAGIVEPHLSESATS